MKPRTTPALSLAILIGISLSWSLASDAPAEQYRPIPGLSPKDRVVLAQSMVQQGQCHNGLVEVMEAMKDLPNDETLLRLKGQCEVEMGKSEAKETILQWLKLAPQTHPERGNMLALLAKTQAPEELDMEWIVVPAGEFDMGSDGQGQGSEPDEAPKHKVHLDEFLIGKFEVTNAQYRAFVKATGHRVPVNCCDPKYNLWRGHTMLDGIGELPAINVSWDDTVAFCKWAGGRLPTEAEWEKAARGTDGRIYPWGNDPPSGNRANYSFDPLSVWEGPASLASKDQYEHGKSPYGAYEMAGNVWEWVQDWYDENYYKNSPAKNPKGPESGQARVIRGGSWRNTGDMLRSANRNKHDPTERRVYLGFRCAKDAKALK